MSKIFYDHLIDFSEVEKKVKKIAKTPEEREEIYRLIDEIIHHRVIGCILNELPEKNHKEFLQEFSLRPYDEGLFSYLGQHIGRDIGEFIKQEVHMLTVELLSYIEERTRPAS